MSNELSPFRVRDPESEIDQFHFMIKIEYFYGFMLMVIRKYVFFIPMIRWWNMNFVKLNMKFQ